MQSGTELHWEEGFFFEVPRGANRAERTTRGQKTPQRKIRSDQNPPCPSGRKIRSGVALDPGAGCRMKRVSSVSLERAPSGKASRALASATAENPLGLGPFVRGLCVLHGRDAGTSRAA